MKQNLFIFTFLSIMALSKVGSFDNDYTIVSKIGEGSFGSVYKVYHKSLQVYRALKTIKKNPTAKFSVFA